MSNGIIQALSLVDASGFFMIGAIVACLAGALVVNQLLRIRYAAIARNLWQNPDQHQPFDHAVLNNIVREARLARLRTRDVNTQALIEHHFQSDLKLLLLGERFVRASTGLMIILGLVGTFYGLTLSIGKLVHLVSAREVDIADITVSLTTGLTQALAGMSVAFSTSLFGICGAIVMMLVGIVSNVSDQRTRVMVQIETFVDHVLQASADSPRDSQAPGRASEADKLERVLKGLSQSVATLDQAVSRFDTSLKGFARSTREFQEFNLHLKDNVQRMSLSFADLSETIKAHASSLRPPKKEDDSAES